MAEIKPWDTAYEIPENPQYDPVIRALKCSDRANAEIIFNPLFRQIITNVHAVKLSNDGKAEKSVVTTVNLTASSWTGSSAHYVQQISVNGIIKTNNTESLVYVVPINTTANINTISDCNISATEISSNKIKFSADKKPSATVNFIIVNAGIVNI